MCSQEPTPATDDPARLMPRVVASAWALLATRPASPRARQEADTADEQRKGDDDA